MNRNKLIVEEFACWGCKACEVACKQEHNPIIPGGSDLNGSAVKYLSVREDGPKILDGKLHYMFRVDVCRHCDDPVCVKACPQGAIRRDAETGIVLHDGERCDGCRAVAGKPGSGKMGASPCKAGCPAGNNVQGFVGLAEKGKYREALQLIRETSPFPSICGRVCYHPCESDCSRKEIDEPVSIRSIERFVADRDAGSAEPLRPGGGNPEMGRVAVIGSGPAGLSAAWFLARDGYRVTVFERLPVAGGMMAAGIPEYRLPREVLSREIETVQALGVEIRTGVEVGRDVTVAGLRKEGVKAFFLAVGAHQCKRLAIEGEDLEGVYPGVDFLRDVNLGKKVRVGGTVAVIGGGNVAMDSVRTALRSGGSRAMILYRRTMEDMPAGREEIRECEEEGISFYPLADPKRIIGENGKVKAIECFRMKPGEPDETGRRKPVPIPGSEFVIGVDTVIPAVGQESDWSCLGPGCGCTLSEWGTMKVDPVTMQTDESDIFAGGDAVTGPRTVVEAIAAGREAALSIDRYLRGLSLHADRDKGVRPIAKPQVGDYDPAPRAVTRHLDPAERVKGFAEVRPAITEEMAAQEAKRCISCGASCIQACPYNAITFDEESGKATKCNLCYHRVTNGLYPACADNICLAHCIYFGAPSEMAQKIMEKRKRRGGWGEVLPKEIEK